MRTVVSVNKHYKNLAQHVGLEKSRYYHPNCSCYDIAEDIAHVTLNNNYTMTY